MKTLTITILALLLAVGVAYGGEEFTRTCDHCGNEMVPDSLCTRYFYYSLRSYRVDVGPWVCADHWEPTYEIFCSMRCLIDRYAADYGYEKNVPNLYTKAEDKDRGQEVEVSAETYYDRGAISSTWTKKNGKWVHFGSRTVSGILFPNEDDSYPEVDDEWSEENLRKMAEFLDALFPEE